MLNDTKPCPYNAFFDRDVNSINGLFSIVDAKTGKKLFNRLPVRSGQRGFTSSSWVVGKSPIPFSSLLDLPLRIALVTPQQRGEWAGLKGIGEFWPIHNVPGNLITIQGKGKGEFRHAIGAHPENGYPGSAGCVVFVHDTEAQKAEVVRLSNWVYGLIGKYDYMPLTVL